MKALFICFACLILPGVILAQTAGQPPDSSANNPDLRAEVKALREALQQTQNQVANQQHEIETLKAQSKDGPTTSAANQISPMKRETNTRSLPST